MQSGTRLFIGLMSGTSLDGVDGVLASIPEQPSASPIATLAAAYIPFPAALRSDLMALQSPGADEIHREALAANAVVGHYAECVMKLLGESGRRSDEVSAIGAHGQTVRHRPELGYTRQINNPALLAELTGIDVIADLRSRDIAAGGQGAPLVPAFHQAVFGAPGETRVVANIGGIANISVLDAGGAVTGFDTGPGNVLMDAWILRHRDKAYDDDGRWAREGKLVPELLNRLRAEPFFGLPAPKSTGRDLFHTAWLDQNLRSFATVPPADIQATLAALTATTLADAIAGHAPSATGVYVCGGGAYNGYLLEQLQEALSSRGHGARVGTTALLGVSENQVEALAFAWLAHRFVSGKHGNLPAATGARGQRMLGALYPAG